MTLFAAGAAEAGTAAEAIREPAASAIPAPAMTFFFRFMSTPCFLVVSSWIECGPMGLSGRTGLAHDREAPCCMAMAMRLNEFAAAFGSREECHTGMA
ncbi:hypothetical protein GCM10010129_73190 [Streptomyces fumigatiscleroticus]|nr:hypothetical protein GCM10010129_73190 [Streptomyces fumigatiscleroticus]